VVGTAEPGVDAAPSPERAVIVAVIDSPDPERVVVWWVNLGEGLPGADTQLCGAWTLAADDAALVRGVMCRAVWLPTPSGEKALADLGIDRRPVLDAGATRRTVIAEGNLLLEAFAQEQAKRGDQKLIDFVVPVIPGDLAVGDLPAAKEAPETVQVALGLSRWVESLYRSWQIMESRRLARPYLREQFGVERRPMPLVLR
jgi:hypothetical protein